MKSHMPLRWRALLIGAAVVVACLGMAWLQLWRAQTRGAAFEQQQANAHAAPIALTAQHQEATPLLWRPVTARGSWLAAQTLFLDNKVYRGRVGYQVLTPLQLEGSRRVVLVNRGWTAAPRLRSELPRVQTPAGVVQIGGIARGFDTRVFELAADTRPSSVWQHLRREDFLRHSGLDALPVILLQTPMAEPAQDFQDGLVRDWSDVRGPDNPAIRHYGYAAMWLVFAALAMAHSIFNWRKS